MNTLPTLKTLCLADLVRRQVPQIVLIDRLPFDLYQQYQSLKRAAEFAHISPIVNAMCVMELSFMLEDDYYHDQRSIVRCQEKYHHISLTQPLKTLFLCLKRCINKLPPHEEKTQYLRGLEWSADDDMWDLICIINLTFKHVMQVYANQIDFQQIPIITHAHHDAHDY